MTTSLRTIIFGFCLPALLLGGCGCNQSAPIDEIEEPVVYVGRPPSTFASLVAPLVPEPVSSWGNEELMLLDAATGETWQLTSNGQNDFQPIWSPSGTHLMYLSVVDPSYFATKKIRKLFVYDIQEGTTREVDLSWAMESGPAAPRRPVQDLPGYLECAAWSPVDSTQIAVGVQIDRMSFNDPGGAEHRIVLLDMEERTGRIVAEDASCSRMKWSPDGKYILVTTTDTFDFVDVNAREKRSIQGEHIVAGEPLSYVGTDWGPGKHTLLVRGFLVEPDTLIAYRYDVEQETWSEPLGRFGGSQYVLTYAPFASDSVRKDSLDLIMLRTDPELFYDDFWRYERPEGDYSRLTKDRMPKTQGAVSYKAW